jgi:hypothetical protein
MLIGCLFDELRDEEVVSRDAWEEIRGKRREEEGRWRGVKGKGERERERGDQDGAQRKGEDQRTLNGHDQEGRKLQAEAKRVFCQLFQELGVLQKQIREGKQNKNPQKIPF